MRDYYRPLILLAMMILCVGGCSSNSAVVKNDQNQKTVNVIALMPVDNKTEDIRIQRLLRDKLLEELRFKGYVHVTVNPGSGGVPASGNGKTGQYQASRPQDIQEFLGADAALYCTLQESRSQKALFYTPATVAVSCELRSTITGETIWDARHRSTSRSFDLMNSKLRSNGALESALEEAVGKVMETLPYGPKLRG